MRRVELSSGKTLVIRDAQKSDALAVIDYLNRISNETDFLTFGDEFQISEPEEEKFIETFSKQDNALFIVAEIEGCIVGSLGFFGGARPRTMHVGEFGVSVIKQYWNNGIGGELVKYLIPSGPV